MSTVDPLHAAQQPPEHFVPTPPGGWTDAQSNHHKQNISHHRPDKSVWQILAENLFTPFNALNAALAVCLALVGSWRNMLFLGVVFSNTLIGTVQELRARHTIRRLTLLNAPTAHVLRNGRERTCLSEELVEGDLVLLHAGDQVMADALVRKGHGAANESLLTGESTPVTKHEGDMLLSGSYIVEGSFTAQLTAVGDESYASRLTASAKVIRRPKSVLMTEVNRLIRFVSIVLIPVGLLLFCKQFFYQDQTLASAVPTSVAAMIGMIPEGLMLLISVSLSVGVVKLGRHNTLVRELYGIETLARADVLCLDKTGTITTGQMQLDSLHPLQGDESTLRQAFSRFLGAMEETAPTLEALRKAIPSGTEAATAFLPFSSERKKSAVSFADGTTLILGAPTFVLDEGDVAALSSLLSEAASRGLRVLVLATAQGCVTETDTPPHPTALGLCLLTDEIRPAAAETLAFFRDQEVTIKIISGDDEKTVAAIARKIGLDGEAVDVSTLTDDALLDACERCTVFGRVTPSRKKALVEALKQKGHHVAMTGDGVNDIPALKAADCSIAMAGGSDATKQAAQLTLLDSNFANLPLIVAEGRRVVGNITRAASLFLVKTLYSFVLALLTIVLPVEYPFQPIQLTLISTLTIGFPAFLLTLEGNHEPTRGDFLRTVLSRAIPSAAAVCVCSLLAMAGMLLSWPMEDCKTLATICAGAIGLMTLCKTCIPFTRWRMLICACMTALFVLAVCFLKKIFFFSTLSLMQYLSLIVLIAVAFLVMRVVRQRLEKTKYFS